MKASMLLLVISIGVSRIAAAGPCTGTTLDLYITLGTAGCTIGTNTIFGFQELLGQAGATQIPASSILVTPSGGSTNPAVQFSTTLTVTSPAFDEALITYQIAGHSYTSEMTTLAGTSASGGADATTVQNYCLNGTFSANGVTGCPGDPSGTHNVLINFNNGSAPATFLPPPTSLSITDDYVLDASGGGSITGGSVTDAFSAVAAVPEPGTYLLIGLAAIAGLFIKRSRPAKSYSGR